MNPCNQHNKLCSQTLLCIYIKVVQKDSENAIGLIAIAHWLEHPLGKGSVIIISLHVCCVISKVKTTVHATP